MDINNFNTFYIEDEEILKGDYLVSQDYWDKVFCYKNLSHYHLRIAGDNRIVYDGVKYYHFHREKRIWVVISIKEVICIIGDDIGNFFNMYFFKGNQLDEAWNFRKKSEDDTTKKNETAFFKKQRERCRAFISNHLEVKRLGIDSILFHLTDKEFGGKLNQKYLINVYERQIKQEWEQCGSGEDARDWPKEVEVLEPITIDLQTGNTFPRSPEDYMTTETNLITNYFKNKEDKEDALRNLKENIIEPICGIDEIAIMGAYMEALRGTDQHFVVVNEGSGMNGKTKIMEFLQHTYGENIVKTVHSDLLYKICKNRDQALHDCIGARILIADEAENNQVCPKMLKRISENSTCYVNLKYIPELVRVDLRCRLFISKNQSLNLGDSGNDGGLQRRIKAYQYKRVFYNGEDDTTKQIPYNEDDDNHRLADMEIENYIKDDNYRNALFLYMWDLSMKYDSDEIIKIINETTKEKTNDLLDSYKPQWIETLEDEIEVGTPKDYILWKDFSHIPGIKKIDFKQHLLKHFPSSTYKDRKNIKGTYVRDVFIGLKKKEIEIYDDLSD